MLFFFFLIHQKEVTFEGHLLRIPWLFLAMRYVRNNAVFCENSSEETEHLVFTEKLKKNKIKKIQVPVLKGLIMLDQTQNILQRY